MENFYLLSQFDCLDHGTHFGNCVLLEVDGIHVWEKRKSILSHSLAKLAKRTLTWNWRTWSGRKCGKSFKLTEGRFRLMSVRNPFSSGWWDIETSYPWKLWIQHPWKCTRPGRMALWAIWCSGRCLYHGREARKRCFLRSLLTQNILWFYHKSIF